MFGQDLDAFADLRDHRGPDEHAPDRADSGHVHVGLERVHLPAVGVAFDLDVHEPQERLATEDFASHEDHPGTRAEHGHTLSCPGLKRLHQAAEMGQLRHRRALPARDGQDIDGGQLIGGSNQNGRRSARLQHGRMLAEVSLQREDTGLHHRPIIGGGVEPPSALGGAPTIRGCEPRGRASRACWARAWPSWWGVRERRPRSSSAV